MHRAAGLASRVTRVFSPETMARYPLEAYQRLGRSRVEATCRRWAPGSPPTG